MNIYKVSQKIDTGWNTYDSCIVCANDEKTARTFHPEGFYLDQAADWRCDWVTFKNIDKLKVELIGVADQGIAGGVILASFNAG